MSRAITKIVILAMAEELNEEMREHFLCISNGKRTYTRPQKDYALSLIDTHGVRATSRILQLSRRTIQRWCREYHKVVRRCPAWVYEWAGRRRRKREFWERRGYY